MTTFKYFVDLTKHVCPPDPINEFETIKQNRIKILTFCQQNFKGEFHFDFSLLFVDDDADLTLLILFYPHAIWGKLNEIGKLNS